MKTLFKIITEEHFTKDMIRDRHCRYTAAALNGVMASGERNVEIAARSAQEAADHLVALEIADAASRFIGLDEFEFYGSCDGSFKDRVVGPGTLVGVQVVQGNELEYQLLVPQEDGGEDVEFVRSVVSRSELEEEKS